MSGCVLTGWPRPNYKMSLGLKFLFYKTEIKTAYLPHVLFLDLGDSYVGVFMHSLCDNSLSGTFFLFGPLICVKLLKVQKFLKGSPKKIPRL